jgi:hypothetical protein
MQVIGRTVWSVSSGDCVRGMVYNSNNGVMYIGGYTGSRSALFVSQFQGTFLYSKIQMLRLYNCLFRVVMNILFKVHHSQWRPKLMCIACQRVLSQTLHLL